MRESPRAVVRDRIFNQVRDAFLSVLGESLTPEEARIIEARAKAAIAQELARWRSEMDPNDDD